MTSRPDSLPTRSNNSKRTAAVAFSASSVVSTAETLATEVTTSETAKTTTTTTTPTSAPISCPYLDTIQRSQLDFDLEPTCSVSLQSGPHIYACCVCGKFFRGRGPTTPLYTHAVEESHYVYIHLTTTRFYCLPENYEIHDASLSDIRHALHPTFSPRQIRQLEYHNTALSRDLFGQRYLPGFVGLNNLNKTDCINAVVQALAHVRPLRDFFLAESTRTASTTGGSGSDVVPYLPPANPQHRSACDVTRCFGQVVRNMWSDARYKAHVDPHRLVNAISTASGKKYGRHGVQPEAGEFIAWLLHQLHLGTRETMATANNINHPTKKHRSRRSSSRGGTSIIEQVFQGTVRVTTRQARRVAPTGLTTATEDVDDRAGSDVEEDDGTNQESNDVVMKSTTDDDENNQLQIAETTVESHFFQLTLDISEKPLFRDEDGGLVIPQEPLVTVLQKFDGVSFSDCIDRRTGVAQRRRYALQRLPDYLILHLARFTANQYSREKNPTIVVFPVKNLDLSNYVQPDAARMRPPPPTAEQVRSMTTKELKELLTKYGRGDVANHACERDYLVEATVDFVARSLPDLIADKYDLLANITHESPADVGREGKSDPLQMGSYKCHVQNRGTRQWYEMQDLHVKEIMPQQIGVSESYVLIFERKSAQQAQYQPSGSI